MVFLILVKIIIIFRWFFIGVHSCFFPISDFFQLKTWFLVQNHWFSWTFWLKVIDFPVRDRICSKRVGYRGTSSEHLCLWNPLILLENLWFWEVSDTFFRWFRHYISFHPFKTSFHTNISMFCFLKNDIINFLRSEHANYHFQNDILNCCQRIWSVAGSYRFQNFQLPELIADTLTVVLVLVSFVSHQPAPCEPGHW